MFYEELQSRHKILISTLGLNDRVKSSEAEILFHSVVYEASGHDLLLESWQRISSRMQLYLAVHQRAHGRTAPTYDAHQRYLQLALDDRLNLMLEEVEAHMVSVYIRETLIQLWTPDRVRGRVNAVNMVFVGASNELGEFRAGAMAAAMGTVPAVVFGGVGAIAIAGLWAWIFPELRKARRLDGRA